MDKLIDLAIVMIIMFMLPVGWIIMQQRLLTRQAIRKMTESQIESVCKKGYIDLASYTAYMSGLHAMGGFDAEVICECRVGDTVQRALNDRGYYYFDHGELINIRVMGAGELVYTASGMITGCA